MTIPLEFLVLGRPSSVNGSTSKMGSTSKKAVWQAAVKAAVTAELAAKSPTWVGPPHKVDVTVKIFFFPSTRQYIDVDNGLKHTIDAFNPPLLANDRSVMRLITERFLQAPGSALLVTAGVAPVLLKAFHAAMGCAGSPNQDATAVRMTCPR